MNYGGMDNSPLQFTIKKFNGKNYKEWVQSIKLNINGNDKMGYSMGENKKTQLNQSRYNA